MKTRFSLSQKAGLLSLGLFAAILLVWQLLTLPETHVAAANVDPEYAALMGGGGAKAASGFPTPAAMAQTVWDKLSHPFYDNGPNDKGIGIQLGYSLARVLGGFFLAAVVAIPLGFAIGNSRVVYQAINPYVQLLKPISPLAWMPLALYTIKDASASSIFVIFICSLWPMLINTAHGVANVKKDWLDVSRTLEVNPLRKAFRVILPAAAPTVLAGMRISMGIAWLVIVAAEMLVGGTGIGYFVWNEWNNLSLTNVLFAILMIGVVGMALDSLFGVLGKRVAYQE
ncbi:MAG: nitrate ABC transporter permease [Thiobacillus sp.]|uniref:nitrate ABC transporter permease n=1 Tax=Thiobacillus sp. 0-1251 TaxID=1895858 RepID=UPI00096232D5|nr:nitrate ABC transporter permease [Thiobacillus sp. 0-1251]MBN8771268.1 nitrate ABC transporter permease [Thiobacillus sp.]OJY58769.1 MAG: nitrate ABC transporter, permease protein [Thiobacillus sp. 0-1251]